MTRDRLLERLQGLQALAERGEDNERDVAAALLEEMMRKHGIQPSDLEDEAKSEEWFRYKTDYERRLINQIVHMVMGNDTPLYKQFNRRTKKPYKLVGVECSKSEIIEIEAAYNIFRKALADEMDLFFIAFIQKNKIYDPTPSDSKDKKPLSDEDLKRLGLMVSTIKEQRLHKLIEG